MNRPERDPASPFRNHPRFQVLLLFIGLLSIPNNIHAQTMYFPPNGGDAWETTDPATLDWCPERIDSLYDFLGDHGTKAFILLKDGRIVLEHYFGTFTQDSLWYWASAGKTLTSTMVGLAQEDGFLDIEMPTDTYLGNGWTTEPPDKEALITVRDQLSMTSGLDDGVPDVDCTDPACLSYIADAGTRWAYHNAPYTLLQSVVANASGQNFNSYFNNRLRDPIGMSGLWLPIDNKHVYYSNARSAARFGLLALNHMIWDTDTIMHDTAYFHAATTPSQDLNPSYGYLWWLNGQSSFMLPTTQFIFPGPLMPNEPADAYNGLGKNDQLINVVPGQGIVLVRLGEAAYGTQSVATVLNDQIWEYINALDCSLGIAEDPWLVPALTLVPNPARDRVRVQMADHVIADRVTLHDALGRQVLQTTYTNAISIGQLAPGHYTVMVETGSLRRVLSLLKE